MLLAYANAISPGGTSASRFVGSLPGALAVIAFASLVWEVLAPRVLSGSTPDIADVAAYLAGAVVYLSVMRLAGARCAGTSRSGPSSPLSL